MRQRMIRFVPGVFASLLAAVALTILTSGVAAAANECIAEPTSKTTGGGHWYYRSDRDNNRRCWFLVEPGSRTPQVEAPQAQPSPDAAPQPTFSSFFSSLAALFTKTNPAETQQDPARSDAPIKQTMHPNAPRNGDGGRRTRVADRPDANATLGRKQHRRSSTQLQNADEQRPAPARNQAEQDALFQEFLRWKQRQTP